MIVPSCASLVRNVAGGGLHFFLHATINNELYVATVHISVISPHRLPITGVQQDNVSVTHVRYTCCLCFYGQLISIEL